MRHYKIDWESKTENNIEFIFNIISLLFNNSLNFMKNDNCDHFIISNFNLKIIEQLDDKTIPFQTLQRILYKLIIIYKNLDNKSTNHITSKLVSRFVSEYDGKKTNSKEITNFFNNLISVLYNLLLVDYKDEQVLGSLISRIFQIIRLYEFKEDKHLSKLFLIVENLKLSQYKNLYQKFSQEFSKIEAAHNKLVREQVRIWWDKMNYNKNKYSSHQIEKVLEKLGEVKTGISFKNIYLCDLYLKIGDKEKYIDFISYYHINNFEDNTKNKNLNKKYIRKKEIFEQNNAELIYVPFEDVLEDANNIIKYIQ